MTREPFKVTYPYDVMSDAGDIPDSILVVDRLRGAVIATSRRISLDALEELARLANIGYRIENK